MDDTLFDSHENTDISKLNLQELSEQLHDLEAKLEILTRETARLEKENSQLKKENAQLKRPPLFVATGIDILDTGEIYLRQQGNNQEYITNALEPVAGTLKPGMKVAVNNALQIIRTVGNTFDSRVRVMELEESPDVTFKHVGGLKTEIE